MSLSEQHHPQATRMTLGRLIKKGLRQLKALPTAKGQHRPEKAAIIKMSHSQADKEVIGKNSTIEDAVRVLSRMGCPDITSSIDLEGCSTHPVNGGSYCDIFLGKLNSGTLVAIKTWRVFGNAGVDSDFTKLLKNTAKEFYHWSKLSHPNILPLVGLALFRGRISMVSEWMENGSLPCYLRKHTKVDRTRLCIDISAGLCYMHEQDMVHGDLKGANVVISPTGVAMITDFGSARLKEFTLRFTNASYSGGFTLRWAAPELLSQDEINHVASKSSDVWAYGMTALACKTDYQVLDSLTSGQYPTKPSSNFSDELWEIITLCWSENPSKRPSIAVVRDHLIKSTLNQPQNIVPECKERGMERVITNNDRPESTDMSLGSWSTDRESTLSILYEALTSQYNIRKLATPHRGLDPLSDYVIFMRFSNDYRGMFWNAYSANKYPMELAGVARDRTNVLRFLDRIIPQGGVLLQKHDNALRKDIEMQVEKVAKTVPTVAIFYLTGQSGEGIHENGGLRYITGDRKQDGTLQGFTQEELLQMFSNISIRTMSLVITDFCNSGNIYRLRFRLLRTCCIFLHVANRNQLTKPVRGGHLTRSLAEVEPRTLPQFLFDLRQRVDGYSSVHTLPIFSPNNDAIQVPQLFCSFKLPLDDPNIFSKICRGVSSFAHGLYSGAYF
ncbi:hypothetical protein OPQ81_010294 [Rhizoctonia solani]|nr:hypothetical protein OPQ81_010294 [Rhizoctonia solani]